MNPKVWGYSGWKFLFSVSCDYPEKPNFQVTNNYKHFFESLQYVLPCVTCRVNYSNHLVQMPIEPYLTHRDNLFIWILKVHNRVNMQQGKPILTRGDIINKYFGGRECLSDCRRDPRIWGLDGWKFLFSIAYEYPRNPVYQDVYNYKQFFTYLQYVLPCETYRQRYSTQLNIVPMDSFLTTRIYLFRWVLQMHNLINKDIGRPLLSHEEVLSTYFNNQIHILKHHNRNPYSRPIGGLILTEGFDSHINDQNMTMAMAVLIVVIGVATLYKVSQ